MASDSWFYSDGGPSFGPVGEEVVQQLIADGTIGREHFVMREGEKEWEQVSDSTFAPILDQIWYYSDSVETYGPYAESAINELVMAETITVEHFVMSASETEWTAFPESKFASIRIKKTAKPTGRVAAAPMRKLQPVPVGRPKTKARTNSDSTAQPPAAGKPGGKKKKAASKKTNRVPAKGLTTVDRVKSLTSELAELKKESDAWMRRAAEAERERGDALKESQENTKKFAALEKELSQLNLQFDRSTIDVEQERNVAAALREDLEIAGKKLKAVTAAKTERERRLVTMEFELSKAQTDGPDAAETVAGLKASLKDAEEKLSATEAELAANTESESEWGDKKKAKRLSKELLETSTLLAKAKERQAAQERKIAELESVVVAASGERDAESAELAKRIRELEAELEKSANGKPAGAADQKRVWALEAKLNDAEAEANEAREELDQTKILLSEALEHSSGEGFEPEPDDLDPGELEPPRASSKIAWVAAAFGFVLAAAAGIFAWNEHANAPDKERLRSLESELGTANADLADAEERLNRAKRAAMETGTHAEFTARLLDRIASVSGPVDPDLIAKLRRETEAQFGLAENTDPRDGETAERAAQLIADGDKAHSEDNHAEAQRVYRDAALLLVPLLEKYPSKAFWRGDIVTAYTRQAREELALEEAGEAEVALVRAVAQLEILQADDPARAAVRTGELADVWEQFGDAVAETGDSEKASDALGRSLAFNTLLAPKGNSSAVRRLHAKLGEVASSANELEEAADHFEKATEGLTDGAERARLVGKLIQANRKLGKLPEAVSLSADHLAHYHSEAEKDGSIENLLGYAKSLNLYGEIRRDSKDFEGAVGAHNTAGDILRKLIAENPADLAVQREIAVTGIRAGELEMAKADRSTARARFEECIPTFRKLVADDPKDVPALKDLEYVYLTIARSHALDKDHESALVAYREALQMSQLLAAAAPKNRSMARNLASWKTRVGNYQKELKEFEGARENLRDALRILKMITGDDAEPDPEVTREIAELNKSLGDLEMAIVPDVAVTPEVIDDPSSPPEVGTPEGTGEEIPVKPEIIRNEGEQYYREAIVEAKRVADGEPENSELQRELGDAYEMLASFLMTGGRFPEAVIEYQRCLAVRKELVEKIDPPEPVWLFELARAYSDMAFIEAQTGTISIGEQYYVAALNNGENAVQAADAAGSAIPADWFVQNAETYLRLGEIDQVERQIPQARRRFQRAVDILNIITVKHDQYEWKLSLVQAYVGLATTYEIGEPSNPARARALYGEGIDVLENLKAAGKLEASEFPWIARIEEMAKR